MAKKILLGLTTTPGSDWMEKTREIDRYKIKELALFPTFLNLEKRKELYRKLEETGLESIPHVHLRDDMEEWEIGWFRQKYHTRVFNIHSRPTDEVFARYFPEYQKDFFVENGAYLDDKFFEMAEKYGGFCFDVSHYHDFAEVQERQDYKKLLPAFEKIKVGCCHVSAIQERSGLFTDLIIGKALKGYSSHYLRKMNEIDYVEDYVKYLSDIVSLELENSLGEQLEIKKRLKKIISRASL